MPRIRVIFSGAFNRTNPHSSAGLILSRLCRFRPLVSTELLPGVEAAHAKPWSGLKNGLHLSAGPSAATGEAPATFSNANVWLLTPRTVGGLRPRAEHVFLAVLPTPVLIFTCPCHSQWTPQRAEVSLGSRWSGSCSPVAPALSEVFMSVYSLCDCRELRRELGTVPVSISSEQHIRVSAESVYRP